MMVRYGFNVDQAYWDGLQVLGCGSTDESIRKTSCNANLKAGGGGDREYHHHTTSSCTASLWSASASGKVLVGDFITHHILR